MRALCVFWFACHLQRRLLRSVTGREAVVVQAAGPASRPVFFSSGNSCFGDRPCVQQQRCSLLLLR